MLERLPHKERANFTFDLKNADPLEASFRFTFVLLGSDISFVATRPEAMYKGLSERLAWNRFTLCGYFILIRIDMSKGKTRPERSDVDWKLVGRRIRELRGFDLTQAEFAQRIGVSQNYLSTMEHGKVQIGAEILLRISQEFEKSIEWLLTGKE
jgi:DNA-binding XRE family transcriptional regulator